MATMIVSPRSVITGGTSTPVIFPAVATTPLSTSYTDPLLSSSIPAIGASWTEEITGESGLMGGTSTRIVDEQHQYSTKQTISKDKTHLRTQTNVYRLSDRALVRNISSIFNSDSHMSHLDDQIMYGVSGNEIRKYNYITDTTEVIATVAGASSLKIGEGEGKLSANDTRIAVNDGLNHWIYDLQTGNLISSGSVASGFDKSCISVSGNYMVSRGSTSDPWTIYDASNFSVVATVGRGKHADCAVDSEGNDVLAMYGPADSSGSLTTYYARFAFLRLSDQRLFLVGEQSTLGNQIPNSGHISGCGYDSGGYALLSVLNSGQTFPQRMMNHLIKMEPTSTQIEGPTSMYPGGVYEAAIEVRPMAWNRTTRDVYDRQARASLSFDGYMCVFNTSWYDTFPSATIVVTEYS